MIRTTLGRYASVVSLVLLLVLGAVGDAIGDGAENEHQFVGSQKCAVCYRKSLLGSQFAVWKRGPHARALETLASDDAY